VGQAKEDPEEVPMSERSAAPVRAEACAVEVLEILPRVMIAVRIGMRRQLQGALSVPQFRCMNFIDLNRGASVGVVAAFPGVTMATASPMVDRLARARCATPGVSERDRRRAALRLRSGKALLVKIRQGAWRDLAAALGRHSAKGLQRVSDALAVLRSVFAASA
jgi:DNA-binding MarR family transcriptional regulator